ncbi:retrovirus-related pol polyprotein from transposon TNT 1-94 [Tanacetum coccineum]
MNELVNDGIKLSKLEINTGFINGLPKKWLSFCQSLKITNHVKDSELASLFDSPDDEEDTRSNHEYLNDLEEEYQARALLAKSKRFFKKDTQRFSSAKATDQTECRKCGKKDLRPTKDFEAKYNKVKAKLALLSSSASASKAAIVKNKGLIVEAYEWDEEEVSSDDNEMVEVKVLMAVAEENDAFSKEGARNGEWVKISMRKILPVGQKDPVFVKSSDDDIKVSIPGVETQLILQLAKRPWLSEAEGFILPNHDTGRILLAESQRNTTDPSVAVTDSSATEYDSTDESLVCVKIYEPSSTPAKGNKSSSASKVNSAPAGKLKSVKIKDDPPLAIVIKELNDLKLQISKKQSSYFRNNQQCERTDHRTCDHAEYISTMNMSQHLKSLGKSSSRSHIPRPSKRFFPPCIHCGCIDHLSNECLYYPVCRLCGSYDHDTNGHNRIISLEREINPRNPQHAFKRCEACGSSTHTITDHYDIEWFKRGEALQAKKAEALKSTRTESSNCDIRKPIWYLDSGCSRHMIGVKSYLHKYEEQPGPKVVFGDDSTNVTEGYGSIKCNGIVFTKVAFVNGLKYNLISISQLCDDKYIVQFDEKKGIIFNSNKEIIMIAPRVRDVYVLDMTSFAQESCFFAKASENLNWLWHKRLAHLNFKTINKLAKQNLVIGLPSLVYSKDKPCSSCEKGKHYRASFKTKQTSSIKKCLHLLHMDLFRPVTPRSINHEKYTLVIIDEYSRNNILVNFCDEKEISQNFSYPYTPEQNGAVERKNRTLIEAARTMLSGSIFSKQYWTEAVATACYTQNRSTIVKRHLKTPYEIFRKRIPNINFLHVFGYPVYIHNHKDHQGKFDEKADDGYLLGYKPTTPSASTTQISPPPLPRNYTTNQPPPPPPPYNQDEENEWETVSRKKRGSIKDGAINRDNRQLPNPRARSGLSYFDKVMKDKAISFFFTNFPDDWDTKALWKMFEKYGKVVDVYIAYKRTKKNTRFGFVRFIHISDLVGFERRLKGILIGDSSIIINRAKFFKVDNQKGPGKDFIPIIPKRIYRPQTNNLAYTHSFREAVVGVPSRMKPIPIKEDKNIRDRLGCCWIGNAKKFQVLQNSWDIIESNGLVDCKVKYCGGLSLLFEWCSKEAAKACMDENETWMKQWFEDLKPWEEKEHTVGKLTWACIEGLPILGRHVDAIKSIVKGIGRVLEIGRLDLNSKVILLVKVLLVVNNMEEINRSLSITLNGIEYNIRIYEERFPAASFLVPEHESKSEVDSLFEEEFIGPSMMEEDGADKFDPVVLSPRINGLSPPHVLENSSDHSFVEDSFGPNNVVGHSGSISQDKTSSSHDELVHAEPVPDLNATLNLETISGNSDKEFDELFSSFQRLNERGADCSQPGIKKKRHKSKNRKLLIGGSSSHPFIPQPGDGDPADGNVVIKSIVRNTTGLRSWLVNIIAFFGIQETQLESVSQAIIRNLWPGNEGDFVASGSLGASGGILTMWDLNVFSKEIEFIDRNFVGVIGSWTKMQGKVGILNVYAPQDSYLKEVLWSHIEDLLGNFNASWVVFGDFNLVRFQEERSGSRFNFCEANAFNDFISRCGLIDFPLGMPGNL